MAHLVTSERVIGGFDPPARGVNRLLPAFLIPSDALRDASNVIYRAGVLRPRPGYSQFHSTVFNGNPTGLFPYLRGASDPVPVLATSSRQYKYDSGTWTDITGSLQTASIDQPARFTTIQIGSSNYIIHSNGKDAPTQWTGASTFSAVNGSPPLWTDICTIQDHVIGIIPPYKVQWGNIRSITSWPTLNTKQAGETVDAVVALRPLGSGGQAVLYKERSLWFVTYTGSQTEATAFAFDPVGFFDGPCSPASVVDVDGAHMYMTPTGRIALFTGSSHNWIADGLWPMIRADIDTSKSGRVWGAYDPQNHEVHFFYPSLTYSSATRGHVCITLPKPDQGIQVFGAFPGTVFSNLWCGATVRLTDKKDFILTAGTDSNRSYKFTTDATSDDGNTISGYWQTGLIQAPGRDAFRLEAVEVFAERGNGYGSLQMRPVVSQTLMDEGTLVGQPLIVPLQTSAVNEPYKAPIGVDTRARFLGLYFSFTSASASTVRFKGATLSALRKLAG